MVHGCTTMVSGARLSRGGTVTGRTMVYLPWYDRDGTVVEPGYDHGELCLDRGRFCRGTPVLVNLDNLLVVVEWLSKSGSRVNN